MQTLGPNPLQLCPTNVKALGSCALALAHGNKPEAVQVSPNLYTREAKQIVQSANACWATPTVPSLLNPLSVRQPSYLKTRAKQHRAFDKKKMRSEASLLQVLSWETQDTDEIILTPPSPPPSV